MAVEVGDVLAEGVLGSEVEVVEFFGFDCGPEFLFWRGELAAEFLGSLTRLRSWFNALTQGFGIGHE